MEPAAFTLALWRVTPGREDEFVRRWSQELAGHFRSLDRQPLWGKLLRSAHDPQVFYSFGPWKSREDVLAMRADPRSREVIAGLAALCDEHHAGLYEEVASA